MKKWLLHTLLFGIIFLIVDKSFYWVISQIPAKQPDRRLEYLSKGTINAQVLILGSSRAIHNIIAEDLSQQVNQKCFNLGFRGTSISFHLQLLKWYIKKNNLPKTIVYVADVPLMFDKDALKYRTDLLEPFVMFEEFRNDLIEKGKLSKLAYGLNFARTNYQIAFKTPSVTIENFTTIQGSNPLPIEAYKGVGENFIANKKRVDDKNKITDFIKLQKICIQNGIQLIVSIPPNNIQLDTKFVNLLKTYLIPSTKLHVYQVNYTTKNNSNFYDVSHLNKNGASIYTQEISTFIKLN